MGSKPILFFSMHVWLNVYIESSKVVIIIKVLNQKFIFEFNNPAS